MAGKSQVEKDLDNINAEIEELEDQINTIQGDNKELQQKVDAKESDLEELEAEYEETVESDQDQNQDEDQTKMNPSLMNQHKKIVQASKMKSKKTQRKVKSKYPVKFK